MRLVKCPLDGSELRITDRQGIEIDYCPQCRGVWLDRGELDKIIERSAAAFDRDDDDDDFRRGDEYRAAPPPWRLSPASGGQRGGAPTRLPK
jgi:Zn-finger nucleic acid-binding protein